MILIAQLIVGNRDDRPQVRACLHQAIELNAREPLNDQPKAAVGQLEHLVDVRDGADRVQVVLRRILDRRVFLREDTNQPGRRVGFLDEAHRCFAGDGQRHEGIGKQHRVAQRQHGHFRGHLNRPFGVGAGLEQRHEAILILIAHRRSS